MPENVRGPVTDLVLFNTCGRMPAGFTDVTGITASSLSGTGSFAPKKLPILKEEKTGFISK